MYKNSELRTQWLQEYFIKPEHLAGFLDYLGSVLRRNDVRLINATIRPTPQDKFSILPYAEQDRYAVVLCFSQVKTPKEMTRTKAWIDEVNNEIIRTGDVYYQAYMPFTTREQFEACYGVERVKEMRRLKALHDPDHVFGNAHTKKYFDAE
jgi:FAD/FMN-containing dehydrogenase